MELTRVWDVCSIYSIEQFAALLCRIGVHCKLIYRHTHTPIKAKAYQYTCYLITRVNTGRLLSQYLYKERRTQQPQTVFPHAAFWDHKWQQERGRGWKRDSWLFQQTSPLSLLSIADRCVNPPPPKKKPQTLRGEVGVRVCALMVCLDQALIQGITPPL